MAQIVDRGTSFQVKWREGSEWQTERFPNRSEAKTFRRDVELNDNHWPEGWVKGRGYQKASTEVETPALTRFATFGRQVVDERTTVQGDTRSDYRKQVAALTEQLLEVVRNDPDYDADDLYVELLTDSHVRRWAVARLAVRARKTVANYHGTLFMIMAEAVEAGLVDRNPCRRTKIGRKQRDPDAIVGLDEDEDKVFLDEAAFNALRAHSLADVRDLLTVAVGTGMRWGELTALMVRDLDLDLGRLTVRRAWKRIGDDGPPAGAVMHDSGARYLGRPKTVKGRRIITLAPPVVAALRRAAAGKALSEFVFTAPQGGHLYHSHFYNRRWTKAIKAARAAGDLTMTPRFHDLRHTHAAWLISASVPLPVIQQRLGHESISITVDTYGGLLVGAHEGADAAITKALAGQRITLVPPPAGVVAVADLEVRYDADDPTSEDEPLAL